MENVMKELNVKRTCEILNQIMEYELAGVIDTPIALMVTGPHRIPIVDFMKLRQLNRFSMLNKQEKFSPG